VFFHISLTS